jgi:predicted amidophosphoribosyltransferase
VVCPSCKLEVETADRFCARCGFPLVASRASKQAAVLSGEFDVDELVRLREEKNRLSRELKTMLDRAAAQPLAPSDQAAFDDLRSRFNQVSERITRQVQYLAARLDFERRQSGRREGERRKQQAALDVPERRSGSERRIGERRSGSDRRRPFG